MENIYVFDDGVIRGFIEMNGTQLSKIYVDSFFQSQGVGDALIRYATEGPHPTFQNQWQVVREATWKLEQSFLQFLA